MTMSAKVRHMPPDHPPRPTERPTLDYQLAVRVPAAWRDQVKALELRAGEREEADLWRRVIADGLTRQDQPPTNRP